MIIEKIWKGGGKHSQKQLNIYYIRSRKRTAGFICSIYYGFKEFVFIRRLDTVILCLILAFYLLLSSMVNHLLALVSKNFWAKFSRWACFNEGLVDARSMTRAWMKFMLVDIPNSDSTVVFGVWFLRHVYQQRFEHHLFANHRWWWYPLWSGQLRENRHLSWKRLTLGKLTRLFLVQIYHHLWVS